MNGITAIVLAKEPLPGRVKTRLTPPCTPDEAANLARAALTDTLDVVARAPVERRILAVEGHWAEDVDGFEVIGQVAGGLDERIGAALEHADGPAVLVGMDTPQLTPELLTACDFERFPAWLGPASDGGYWLIGLSRPDASLIRRVPMSTSYTYERQHERLRSAGLDVGLLPELRDVDTWADAVQVAESAPRTRFAKTVRSIECT